MSKHEMPQISLLEAVETLSSIADMDWEHELGITQEHDLIVQDKKITYKTIHWINKQNAGETIGLVKGLFKVILTYLRSFYNRESAVKDDQTIEGIKTIMVLVGEAAKKLDKYTSMFTKTKTKSVTELREYRQLQEFYQTRIARKVDDEFLGQWLFGLTKGAWGYKPRVKFTAKKAFETKHVFVDLDSVKRDSEYELFYLRKEDGSRFYNPRLIRNIKLICDFGDYFGGVKRDLHSIDDIEIWRDRNYHIAARSILNSLGNYLNRFYRDCLRFKDKEMVELLNKALMALMLCANSHNQLRNMPLKSCRDYFSDFHYYLRKALNTLDYHKLIAYPLKNSGKLAHLLLDLSHAMCMGLFQHLQFNQPLSSSLLKLITIAKEAQSQEHEKAADESRSLWSHILCDYAAMNKYFKNQAYGPLIKVLDILQSGGHLMFDPIWEGNLPCQQFALLVNGTKIMHTRMPSPTVQEFIHKASIINEFKGFIRACSKDHILHKILLINLQDRTSWREHSRSIALEELQKVESIDKNLTVVTLPKDTEFYHQMTPYQQDNHAEVFIQNLKEQLSDANTGFYFPAPIQKALFPHFIDGMIEAIHRVFFSEKNVLLREHRLDFIEIFYMFLQLKLIDLTKADSFSLVCKDGLDIGSSSIAQLYLFIKLLTQNSLNEAERNQFNMILYAPSVLVRERIIHPDRFNRAMSAIKTIESVKDQLGNSNFEKIMNDSFGNFYNSKILQSHILLPK